MLEVTKLRPLPKLSSLFRLLLNPYSLHYSLRSLIIHDTFFSKLVTLLMFGRNNYEIARENSKFCSLFG